MYKSYTPGMVTPSCITCYCRASFDVEAEEYCKRQEYYDSYECARCQIKKEG